MGREQRHALTAGRPRTLIEEERPLADAVLLRMREPADQDRVQRGAGAPQRTGHVARVHDGELDVIGVDRDEDRAGPVLLLEVACRFGVTVGHDRTSTRVSFGHLVVGYSVVLVSSEQTVW